MVLQKAAYSWWWVSHIRTKQSKWLQLNLRDMEEKVCSMLEIIDDDGDSFAKRAEVYFKKRPELVSIVEECYRAYQSLAERYDHLSKDLQRANRTIATVFPEQVPHSVDDEDEASPSPTVRFPNKGFWSQRDLKKAFGSGKTDALPISGLNKVEALDEIDNLHREISDMETEREFLYKKFCEIDNQITEKQRRVCNLEVEFGVRSVIDDIEARTLMKTRDLESCQESESLNHVKEKKHVPTKNVDNDSEVSRNETDEKLDVSSNASRTLSQLVEKIDELVQRVVNWETTFFYEKALQKKLKSENDELREHGKSLEEDTEAEIEGPEMVNCRMNMLEGELTRVNDLLRSVVDEINSLKTHSIEPSCNIDHLSVKAEADSELVREIKQNQMEQAPSDRSSLKDKDVSAERKNNVDFETSNEFDIDSSKDPVSVEENKAKSKCMSNTASSISYTEIEELESDEEEEEEQPKWRQQYLDGVDDREKMVIDEYCLVVENYKEVTKKLNEVDEKNRDGFFELAMQIRDLKSAVASRDGEIQTLQRKIGFINGEIKYANSSVEQRESLSQESTLTNSIQASPSSVGGVRKDGSIGKAVLELENNKPGSSVSEVENKIRSCIDELLEENLEFWLRFSAAFNQIKKYQTSVKKLKEEVSRLREKSKKQGGGKIKYLKSEIRPIYCQFREIKSELTLWMENNEMLKDEVERRYSSVCNIEKEIVIGSVGSKAATKLRGEVANMKQDMNKVWNELKAGLDGVRTLKHEVEKLINNSEKELGSLISSMSTPSKYTRMGSRIPLRSFLFGIKLRNSKHSSMQDSNSYTPSLS